ncbi:hypothetical protein [Clostridium culturomicium]|uniref:hypothetical protein n=1 Tax=Clostridium culturomicium TaxID=1499683 RepID=UPI00385719A0
MNKFQKIAYQIAKDDSKKDLYKCQNVVKRSRIGYACFKSDRNGWPFEKCVDFKNRNKNRTF